MNTSSMNLHRVTSVEARVEVIRKPEVTHQWVALDFKCEDGSRFDLAAHTSDAAALFRQITILGLKQAADLLDKKADDYAASLGSVDPDTGALEFGRGQHAQVKEDHYNNLRELADEIRALGSAAADGAGSDDGR